jgi:hypothetical protein
MHEKLESAFYNHKLVPKKIWKQLRAVILNEIAAEMRLLHKTGVKAATAGLTATSAGALKDIHKKAADNQSDMNTFAQSPLYAINILRAENKVDSRETTGNEEEVEIDALERQETDLDPRGEPDNSVDLPEDEATIIGDQSANDDNEIATKGERVA